MREAAEIRVDSTSDIFRRKGAISASRITLRDFPEPHPAVAFNAGALLEGGKLLVYPRIVFGYYKYVSCVAELEVRLEEIIEERVGSRTYEARIVVHPSNRYDIWGVEDPRVFRIDGETFMVYTGRTIDYFDPEKTLGKTVPVMAVKRGERWRKIAVFKLPPDAKVVSDKDAFLWKSGNRLYLFHRPHLADGRFYLAVSTVDGKAVAEKARLKEVTTMESFEVLKPASFESKLGWAAPPIEAGKGSAIALVHAVDSEGIVYRVFAVKLCFSRSGVAVEAVTPRYIMEPCAPYEVMGDRPYTIFPCGFIETGGKAIVTYGAGDYVIGFAVAELDDLLARLEEGEIH